MTKAQQLERNEAIQQLREWIKPGDTVYTILDHVSASGMSRHIRVVIPMVGGPSVESIPPGGKLTDYVRRDGITVDFRHPNYAVGKVLGLRHAKRNGREQDALVVGGCGMDMGFHVVYELSSVLYGGRLCTDKRHQRKDQADHICTPGDCSGCCVECRQIKPGVIGGYPCLGKDCPSSYHQGENRNKYPKGLIHTDGYALRHRWL